MRFGNRVAEIIELDDNPYEPDGDLWVALVLQDEGFDYDRADRLATGVGMDLSASMDFAHLCHVYVLSESQVAAGESAWARAAQAGGPVA